MQKKISNNNVKTEKEIDRTSTNSADNSDQEDSENNSDKSDISNKNSEKRIIKEEKIAALQISKKIKNHFYNEIYYRFLIPYYKKRFNAFNYVYNLYFF